MNIQLNAFAVGSGLLAIVTFFLAFVSFKNWKNKLYLLAGLLELSMGVWAIFAFFIGITDNFSVAYFCWQGAYIPVVFSAIFLYHVVYHLSKFKNKILLQLAYTQGLFFSFLALCRPVLIMRDLRLTSFSCYWLVPSPLYHLYTLIWMSLMGYSLYKLLFLYRESYNLNFKRNQTIYIFLSFFIGIVGGILCFVVSYGLDCPYGNFLIALAFPPFAYTIFKYRLFDIKVAIVRLFLFLFVYSIIIGVK